MRRAHTNPLVVLVLAVAAWGGACHRPAHGQGFAQPDVGERARSLHLRSSHDGGLLLSWLEPHGDGHRLVFTVLEDGRWSPPKQVAAGGSFLANWADTPAVVQGPRGVLYAHWLETLGEGHAYGARAARSANGGDSWVELGWLHDDTSPVEHGFVSYAVTPKGLRAFWLDGRTMGEPGGATALRTALVGQTEGTPPSVVLDPRVCECCATDAVKGPAGPVVVYRDRSEDEVRDISLLRWTTDGWSAPITVHRDGWQIDGCPVNGPAIDARDDRVAVAWFTAAGESAAVKLSVSTDGGQSFGVPTVVDGDRPVGRADVALGAGGRVWVLWVGRGGAVELGEFTSNGTLEAAHEVAERQGRSSVPKLASYGAGVAVAFSSEKTIRVETFR